MVSPWAGSRASWYGVSPIPDTRFDGWIAEVGAGAGTDYHSEYNSALSVPTDVTIELVSQEVGVQQYEVTASICIEPTGAGKTMRIQMVQVLDHWPAGDYRNGLKQGATSQDITLAPGQCQDVVRTFTFDATSWANQNDIRIIAWAHQITGGKRVYQAGVINWPFTPAIPTGACCHAGQSCTVGTAADCATAGGIYSGDDTDCSPNPCIPDTGACCFSAGSCYYILHASCDSAGGTYLGDLVECDPNPCPQPSGGCCHTDGSCTIETSADCATAGGAYEGDDTACNPNPCPQPTGACCHTDGSCTIETPADCATAGGTYWGNDTACDPDPCPQVRGACCLPPLYADCLFVTLSACDGYIGIYRGDDVPCTPTNPCPPPSGACCHPGGSCTEEPQAACETGGGTYQGDSTVCTPDPCSPATGACCHADGSCTVVTAADCGTAGGAYEGDDTVCDPNPCPQPWGACCYSGGSCTEGSPTDCAAAGGVYEGNATTCTPNSCVQTCPEPIVYGDMNGDSDVDGGDIQGFVDAIIAASREASDVCPGDFDGSLLVGPGDIPFMVAALLE